VREFGRRIGWKISVRVVESVGVAFDVAFDVAFGERDFMDLGLEMGDWDGLMSGEGALTGSSLPLLLAVVFAASPCLVVL
jgi:hypothetical protein